MAPPLFPLGRLPREGWLQGSKWLTFRALIDAEEMEDLVQACQSPLMVNVSSLVSLENSVLEKKDFCACYRRYTQELAKGQGVQVAQLRPYFSAAWTLVHEAFRAFPAPDQRWMIKPVEPIVQLSPHFFFFSSEKKSFRSMTYGPGMIPWGLQFSYPQLYAQSTGGETYYAAKTKRPNHKLLQELRKWMRRVTRPARFVFEEKRVIATFRVSHKAAEWICSHPLLQQHKLRLIL